VEGEEDSQFVGKDLRAAIAELERRMKSAAADLEFEKAARFRDEIKKLEALELGIEGVLAPNLAGRSLQDAAPRAPERATSTKPERATSTKPERATPKKRGDWKPKPLGPGGGGYEPSRVVRGGGRRRG